MDNDGIDSDEIPQDELDRLEAIMQRVKSGEEQTYTLEEAIEILGINKDL